MKSTGVRRQNVSRPFAVLLSLMLMALLAMGCGGSKKGDNLALDDGKDMSIDELLGIEEQPKDDDAGNGAGSDADAKSKEEADVLRLLGISNETETTPEENSSMNTGNEPAGGEEMSDVEMLRAELNAKDKMIAELRANLDEKNKRLESLQTESLRTGSTRSISAGDVQFTPTSASGGSFKARYRDALALYNRGKYRESIGAFQALLAEDSNNSLSDNCQYWIGEAYYGLGNYSTAVIEFEKMMQFPRSNKLDAATLKIGLTYLRLNNKAEARSHFQQLIDTFPNSEFVSLARSHLNKL